MNLTRSFLPRGQVRPFKRLFGVLSPQPPLQRQVRRCFDVAVDHGFFNQPGFLKGIESMPEVIRTLVDAGPDAIQLTVGQARHFQAIPGRQKPFLVLRTDVADIYGSEFPSKRFSTAEPKTLWIFERGKEQWWKRTELGFSTPFKTVAGGIFEPGFPDVIQQMWAAFLAEREGLLGDRFGCATPDEAVPTHQIFAAALRSHAEGRAVELPTGH